MDDLSLPKPSSRVALVTGGARRIGRAVVLALAEAGYSVAIHANGSIAEAEELAGKLRQQGGKACALQADLMDDSAVDGLIDAANAALGPLTLLVNNASEFQHDEVTSLDRSLWHRHFRINLEVPAFLSRDFARQAPAGSSIVNLLDQRVLKPTPLFFSYGLTKAALAEATRTMAQALAPHVRVNAVAPGPTMANARQSAADFAKQAGATLLARPVAVEQIAQAVVYLASAQAVTGQILAVDSGQHLGWQTPDVVGIVE